MSTFRNIWERDGTAQCNDCGERGFGLEFMQSHVCPVNPAGGGGYHSFSESTGPVPLGTAPFPPPEPIPIPPARPGDVKTIPLIGPGDSYRSFLPAAILSETVGTHPGIEPPPVPEVDVGDPEDEPTEEEPTPIEDVTPVGEIDLNSPFPPLPMLVDNRITCPACGRREMDIDDMIPLNDGSGISHQVWSCPHCRAKRVTQTCPLCFGNWRTSGQFCKVVVTSECGYCERGFARVNQLQEPLSDDTIPVCGMCGKPMGEEPGAFHLACGLASV